MTDQPITFLSVHCDDETKINVRPAQTCSGWIVDFGSSCRSSLFLTPKAKEHLMELLSVEPSPNPSERVELDPARPF